MSLCSEKRGGVISTTTKGTTRALLLSRNNARVLSCTSRSALPARQGGYIRERERERRAGGSSRGTSIRTPRLDRWIDRSNVAVGSGGAPAIFSPARRVRNDEFADGDYPHTRHWPIDTFSLSFSLFSLSMTSAWKTAAWTAKGKPRAEGRASVFSFYLSPAMDGKREFGRL